MGKEARNGDGGTERSRRRRWVHPEANVENKVREAGGVDGVIQENDESYKMIPISLKFYISTNFLCQSLTG